MIATARFFLVDAAGRQQRFYSSFAPRLHHDSTGQLHFAEKLTGVAVAAQAKLGRRTFLRRFRRATGFNLKEYLQYLRVDGAREKLEFSSLPINDVPNRQLDAVISGKRDKYNGPATPADPLPEPLNPHC